MIDVQQKKNKIILFLETNGPSLPIRVAKTIEMEPVFASAILSELLGEKRVKMSNMKIGSSSLYLLPGQEKRLEEHSDELKSMEKEAFLKIKNEKLLEDENEEPAIRVALRNIKDFAIPFRIGEKILWRYAFSTDEEIKNILNPPKKDLNVLIEKRQIKKEEIKEKPKTAKIKEQVIEDIIEGEKPEFFSEVKTFLEKRGIEIIEEIKTEKKEITAKVNIDTKIGSLKFLLVAKNKMTTNKEEINTLLQQIKYHKIPCLLLIKKEPQGAIKKMLEDNSLIIVNVMTD